VHAIAVLVAETRMVESLNRH